MVLQFESDTLRRPHRGRAVRAFDAVLRPVSLLASTFGVAVVILAALGSSIRESLVHPTTLVEAGIAGALFVRMLFDRRVRRGVGAASREIQRVSPSFLGPRWLDPEWGIWGTRAGSLSTRLVRAMSFLAFLATLPFYEGRADMALLAAATFAVAMLISLLHLGLTTIPDRFG